MNTVDRIKQIRISDYDYDLPDYKIPNKALSERSNSKLLIYQNNTIKDDTYINIKNYVSNSLMVFNNTKVVQARLHFKKQTGAKIEVFCLEPALGLDLNLVFQSTKSVQFICLVGNVKKWKDGDLVVDDDALFEKTKLKARKLKKLSNGFLIELSWEGGYTFTEILQKCGELPLPPYMNRKATHVDKQSYQTTYAKIEGSVAAPTAGLHFTKDLIKELSESNQIEYVSLHVGAGTFLPVKSEEISGHDMHYEIIDVSLSTLNAIKSALEKNSSIIPVGTTSMRTLESIHWIGVLIHDNPSIESESLIPTQWLPYQDTQLLAVESIELVINFLKNKGLDRLLTKTQIMIAPGYDFKICSGLVTNFHQPKSTLLLLVSALVGDSWKDIYNHAIENNYRFLSYGDGSLLLK